MRSLDLDRAWGCSMLVPEADAVLIAGTDAVDTSSEELLEVLVPSSNCDCGGDFFGDARGKDLILEAVRSPRSCTISADAWAESSLTWAADELERSVRGRIDVEGISIDDDVPMTGSSDPIDGCDTADSPNSILSSEVLASA